MPIGIFYGRLNQSTMNLYKLFILSTLLFFSCSEKKHPKDVLDEKKMVQVLTDLSIVDGYMSTMSYIDSTRINGKSVYNSVYSKHEIGRSAFEKSLKYYSKQPKLLDSMYRLVERNLNIKANRLQKLEDAEIGKKTSK